MSSKVCDVGSCLEPAKHWRGNVRLCDTHAYRKDCGLPLDPGDEKPGGGYNREAAEEAARLGMARSYEASSPAWKELAWDVLAELARNLDRHFADDFWRTFEPRCARLGIEPAKRDALGAIYASAARRGWIVKTGEYVKSERVEAQGKMMPVWRSLVRDKEARG